MPYIITFGQQYAYEPHPATTTPPIHPDGWVEIETESESLARAVAIHHFGTAWAFIHRANNFTASLYPRGCLFSLPGTLPAHNSPEGGAADASPLTFSHFPPSSDYPDTQSLLTAFSSAISTQWRAAHTSPTKSDWTFRWTSTEHALSGMINTLIYVLGLEDPHFDEVASDLRLLWQIALTHSTNPPSEFPQ